VYISKQLGFQIQYPKSWTIFESKNSVVLESPENEGVMKEKMKLDESGESYQTNLVITRFANLKEIPSTENASTLGEFIHQSGAVTNVRDIVLDGRKAFRGLRDGLRITDIVFIERNGKIYTISIDSRVGLDSRTEQAILESFHIKE